MRYYVFNLQYRLPASLLRIPYDILNRMNRNKLNESDDELVKSITWNDFKLADQNEHNLDLFCLLTK